MKGSTSAMNKNILYTAFTLIITVVLLSACNDKRSTGLEYARNMYDPIAYNQDQPNKNFANGATSQTPPANTEPVGFDRFEYPHTKDGFLASGAAVNPLVSDAQNMLEGKHLYNVFCNPCHGEKGDGNGHLVQLDKGIAGVPSYYGDAPSHHEGETSLVKDLSAGKIYHTIVYGLNSMGAYGSQLTPSERWKVVMYVQELQKTK